MKMRKPVLIALSLALVMIAAMSFTACGDEYAGSEYLGKWKCTSGTASEYTIDVEKSLGKFELELKADGSAEADVFGEKGSAEWAPTDDGFALKERKNTLEFTRSGSDVTLEYDGALLTFEKQ